MRLVPDTVWPDDMRTIHNSEPGSPPTDRLDELEAVLGVGRIGYCRINKDLHRIAASSQFKALFGWPPDAALSVSLFEDSVLLEDRAELSAALRAGFDSGADISLAIRVTQQDSFPETAARWIYLRGRAMSGTDGVNEELLLVCEDITQWKQAEHSGHAQLERERSLRATAEAENRAKDEFLSVVSHELRSPLNAILGWNRILAVKRANDPEIAAITPRIEQGAKAQLKMVNDLLDIGRVGTGKLRIEPRRTKFSAAVAAAVDICRPVALAKKLEIHVELDSTEASEVNGDPDRLLQAATNLVNNAVKFTPSGGLISVVLQRVGDSVELRVADTGQGIAADLLPYVFDRFRQADQSATRSSGGLGLGLALAREIVTLHGGTITAASEGKDQGSVFTLTLPAAVSQPADKAHRTPDGAPQENPPPSLQGLSILVVDDEPDARSVVAETLRMEGARVTVSESAGSAIAQLRSQEKLFDVLVTDIGMPEEDGYSLVRKLRALQSGRHVLAIALTGYTSKADVEAAMKAGFDFHMPKPVDFATLVPTIRRMASMRTAVSGTRTH